MKDRKRATYSLRRRLTFAMAAGFMLVLVIISIGLWSYARSAANQTYDLLLQGASIAIEERISIIDNKVLVDLPPAAHQILALSRADRVFYRVMDANGKTITGNQDLQSVGSPTEDKTNQFYDAFYLGELVRFSVRYRHLVSATATETVGVQIGQTRNSRNELQRDIFLKGFSGLAILAVISLVFSRVAITIAMRPLLGIEKNISQRTQFDLSPLAAQPPREIVGLIDSINGFMNRLAVSKDNAEQFIADVAHQMRTSLTTVMGHMQNADNQMDPKIHKASNEKALSALARTINLTNQLLAHAMIMHRHDHIEFEEIDLAQIITAAVERTLSIDRHENIEIEVHIAPKLKGCAFVVGDAVAIKEAIDNVLVNAVQHSGGQCRIWISIEETATSGVCIQIEDDGPGLDLAQQSAVLERFFATGPYAGSGVGLSIVSAAMKSHSGSIELTGSPHGGVCIKLTFPKLVEH
ncbi:sensor histidine kinase [Maritalea porphyrae]|uniref:sensor histidine kinase n=2 Tax=Maritalea TaxID=623276 RepID=UPI0022AF4274|nr:sensor histidine kinase [Maritalea porphyrae]MCZ4271687.1 sensor histidine kinase [Maritalea porphyrae]